MSSKFKIAILMGAYNGAHFLRKQLDSISRQSFSNWELWISDDGSSDETVDIIKDFAQASTQPVNLLIGPGKGVCENFVRLINNNLINADFYAFADQDDIWLEDKLERAVSFFRGLVSDVPALYCGRTTLINEWDSVIGFSPNYCKPPTFSNSLVQNIASGNTMVFNNKARLLLALSSKNEFVMHDWALYIVVTACNGIVYFDPEPSVYYRQHTSNLIGNGMKFKRRVRNFVDAISGRKVLWNAINIKFIQNIIPYMSEESIYIFHNFSSIRNSSLIKRIVFFRRSGVYHQQLIGSLTTLIYTLTNRM